MYDPGYVEAEQAVAVMRARHDVAQARRPLH
jgi:hypothetical protein